MLALTLVAIATATPVDLDVTIAVDGHSSSFRVTDLEIAEGAAVHLTQQFGRREYEVGLTVREESPDVVAIDWSIVRADTGEVISRPRLQTNIGVVATLDVGASSPRAVPLYLQVLPTR